MIAARTPSRLGLVLWVWISHCGCLEDGKNAFGIDMSDLQLAEATRRLDIFEAREGSENARLDEELKARLQQQDSQLQSCMRHRI